jgi:succinoglycan biosynthesis protein ExoM
MQPAPAETRLPHISVCVCTYKRPDLLQRLLARLGVQKTADRFTYSIVVVDNDQSGSARQTGDAFASQSAIALRYCIEPRQNISRARNKAVENAAGDFIAFIDDDEIPSEVWLLTLFDACRHYNVDGVLGPVLPQFDSAPPAWIVKGKFYQRPSYPTGFVIDWPKGRTGNVLLKKQVFAAEPVPFRPEFLTGEDQDFFRRAIARGYVFVWCEEAMAHEVVPAIRWKRSFMLKRALLRGATSVVHPTFGISEVAKSLLAVPAYTLMLPFALLLGQHRFVPLTVKLFDHLGRLLALVGIRPVKQAYVTE